MGKGGHVNKKEPEGPDIMVSYEETKHIFDQDGWYMFFTKLYGHNYGVSHAFVEGFDGQRVRIGNLIM